MSKRNKTIGYYFIGLLVLIIGLTISITQIPGNKAIDASLQTVPSIAPSPANSSPSTKSQVESTPSASASIAQSASPSASPTPSLAPTIFSNIALASQTVQQYGTLEVTFDLSTEYDNPFDPQEVNAEAKFTTPSGQVGIMPAFYNKHSSPKWATRYSPRELGAYKVLITLKDTTGTVQTAFSHSPNSSTFGQGKPRFYGGQRQPFYG